jgi:epoxyqueuosine reductase
MLRNVLIAIGNSGEPGLVDGSVLPHLDDEAPIVRGAAVWALSRLDMARFELEKDRRLADESDAGVKAEWALTPV